MEIKTALASGIEITAGETEYDTSCKRVLAEKHVLAQFYTAAPRNSAISISIP